MNETFSVFENIRTSTPAGTTTIDKLFTDPGDSLKLLLSSIRKEYEKNGKSEQYQDLRKRLPVFTPSALVTRRHLDHVQERTPWIILDIDNISNVKNGLEALKVFPWIYGARVSTSGAGIFAVVKTDPNQNFQAVYTALYNTMMDKGVQVDKLGDVVRARFYSDGPYWVNKDCETFVIDEPELNGSVSEAEVSQWLDSDGLIHHPELMQWLAKAQNDRRLDVVEEWLSKNEDRLSGSVSKEWPRHLNYVKGTIKEPAKIVLEPIKAFDNDQFFTDLPDFPMDVFPDWIQAYIKEKAEQKCIDPAFIAGSCLTALSAVTGEYSLKWGEFKGNGVVWIVCCGPSGSNKSTAMMTPLSALYQIDEEYYNAYQQEMQEYKFMTPKERREKKVGHPKMMHSIITDATPESIVIHHQTTPQGFLWFSDEVIYLLNGVNKYNTVEGGDYSFLLDLFNGKMIKAIRASGDNTVRRVPKPRVPILGGIQNKKLEKSFPMDGSGFIDRFLFVVSNKTDYQISMKEYSNHLDGKWSDFIKSVWGSSGRELKFSDKRFLHTKTQEFELMTVNDMEIETVRKLHIYAGRFAMLLQLMHDPKSDRISREVAESSYRLCEYFFESRGVVNFHIQALPDLSGKKVQMDMLKNVTSGVTSEEKREIASKYVTQGYEITAIAKAMGVTRQTVHRWVKNR